MRSRICYVFRRVHGRRNVMNCKFEEISNGWNNKVIRKRLKDEKRQKFWPFVLGIGASKWTKIISISIFPIFILIHRFFVLTKVKRVHSRIIVSIRRIVWQQFVDFMTPSFTTCFCFFLDFQNGLQSSPVVHHSPLQMPAKIQLQIQLPPMWCRHHVAYHS